MPRGLVTPRRLLVAIVLAMFASSLLPQRYARLVTQVPASVAGLATGLPTELLNGLANRMRQPAPHHVDMGPAADLEARHLELKQQYHNLEQRLQQAMEDIARLSQVRGTLRLESVTPIPARVIAPPRDPSNPLLTISRGTRHGVERGSVVVAGANLVGIVEQVSGAQASVRLITAPNTTLRTRIIAPTGEQGSGREAVKTVRVRDNSGRLTTDSHERDAIRLDDLAHLWDDTWPQEAAGFVVGRVSAIGPDQSDPLSRLIVTIEPLVSLPHLSRVDVLIVRQHAD